MRISIVKLLCTVFQLCYTDGSVKNSGFSPNRASLALPFSGNRQGAFRFFLLLVLVFLSGFASAEEGQRITDIRFWQSPEEAQVVIDLTLPPKVAPMEVLPDGTFYFEIESCHFRPEKQSYSLNNSFLKALTVQERSGGLVRVYFRVPLGIQYRTFLLPKNTVKPDRLVIFLSEPSQVQEMRRQEEIQEVSRLKASNVKIVVIDPGHGGEDPGARHNGVIEKNYVLAMAKLIKAYFDRDARYKCVLTRTGDYIIPLDRRSQIAEHMNADAFISIHANSNRGKAVRGIEVYFESAHGAVGEAERLVADSENQQDYIGAIPNTTPVQKKSQIVQKQATIMFKSQQMAGRLEARLRGAVPGLISRGMKRAGFRVLHSTSLPSALVELGYLSNVYDANLLKSAAGQQRLAMAVYSGLRDFLENPVREGYDAGYLAYVQAVEAEKRAREERVRKARERREQLLANAITYKVRAGETVAIIASRFKANQADIRDINGLGKKKKLRAGQVIRIPRG